MAKVTTKCHQLGTWLKALLCCMPSAFQQFITGASKDPIGAPACHHLATCRNGEKVVLDEAVGAIKGYKAGGLFSAESYAETSIT